jgi:phage shock protein PspC (stress-responsive transcriptional regulator)/FtsH-binding integral membrane protein
LPPADRPSSVRTLRRSDSNRVAAGVAGGLGEYFGVDPVIFRVLFATTAFFGGAGILAYLIAWAAIPERSQAHAPVDRLVAGLRSRNIPLWILVVVAALAIWGGLFSWWGPHSFPWMFFPLTIALLVLIVGLSRRRPDAPTSDATYAPPPAEPEPPVQHTNELAAWAAQARAAARERRRRSAPVRWATIGVLGTTLIVMGIIDSARGIVIPAYFWAVLLIVFAGVVVGAALRRPIWWLSLLLIPAAVGAFVFAGSRASLHDGSSDSTFTPRNVSELQAEYRQAFGRTRLDLTELGSLDAARTVQVTQAAGQVELIVPRSLAVTIHAKVHLGNVEVDGRDEADGMNVNSNLVTAGPGAPLTIDVRLNAGQVRVEHAA